MLKDIYIIGDIHGCYETLIKLLKKIPENSEVIFVGDLCDKGNFSEKVIELLIEKNYKSVLGNHDEMMIRYIENILYKNKDNIWATSKKFGGYKTLNSYKNKRELLTKHLEWLKIWIAPKVFLID